MKENKKLLVLFCLFLFSLIFANNLPNCIYDVRPKGGDSINQDKVPVYYSKDFVLTKPKDFEIITTNNGPYIAANISEINLINQQNNINLLGLGGLYSIFKFSTPYGFAASFFSEKSEKTSITAQDSGTTVSVPGVLQIKVFSVSPEMNGNSSIVYNSRGFPESEFELQAPMVTYGFYGNFSSGFSLPLSNIAYFTNNNFKINEIELGVTNAMGVYEGVADITYKGKLSTTKNATLQEFGYAYVPFLALTENIPMNVFPDLSLNWNIQPFGISGSYFIFSPFNVLGQKKNGKVTIGDVAVGLTYSYLTGGITKGQLFSGIKNVIYHTIPIPVSEVNGGNDKALDAVKRLDQALNNPPQSMDIFQKAKDTVKAISSDILSTPLRQKYLLDPFVFNGSEMLIASYYNASASQHQLYELWYINTTTYYNPTLYYRDSFQTNLLAVGGVGNKIYTLEKSSSGYYTLNTYEVIPLGYKNPTSQLPYSTSSQNLNAPLIDPITKKPQKAKEDFFNSVYSQFNASWIKFFGQTIYEETHDLYRVGSIQLSDCGKFISFTVDKSTGVAYAFCKSQQQYPEGPGIPVVYHLYDSNGNERTLYATNPSENFDNTKIAVFGNLLFLGSYGEISSYMISGNSLTQTGSPIPINYTDLNVSTYANYAYNKKCGIVYDKAWYHNILAMGIYNGFIYLVDHWKPTGWLTDCGIDEVRLRIIGIGSGTDIIIDPFDKEDRLNCSQTQSCGSKTIAPPYGWVLASPPERKNSKEYTFYPQTSTDKFGFPEIGAPISNDYSANMSIDDFGRVYLITSGGGKGLAIIDLQPFNYTISSLGAGSLYACISGSTGSKVIVEQKGVGTKEITQNTKCFSGDMDNIIYIYGSPNILNHLNQIYSLPIGSLFSGSGIVASINTINQGLSKFNEKTTYSAQPPLPPSYSTSQTNLNSSIKGEIILPFYSLYLFNQTAKITFNKPPSINVFHQPNWCTVNIRDINEIASEYAPPDEQTVFYPSKGQVYAKYTFSTASQDVSSEPLQTKFESSNMVFVIYTITNGTILPAFLYQKSLPQQLVSLSLFQILGLGSKGFGEAYLNVTPISPYGAPVDTRSSTISKIRKFDYYTKVWKYGGIILNATGTLQSTEDKSLQKDYYFDINKVIQSAADALNTPLNLAIGNVITLSSQYFLVQVPVLNRKVPFTAFVDNTLSILGSDNLLGRRLVNVTFVDLFNSTFNLPMKLDFAYSTKINATLNTSIDKNNMNLTYVTIRGNLSEVVFNPTTNSLEYNLLPGKIYVYVDRNINYCNKDCSKSLAVEDPVGAIKCSINGNCLLANPLNFTQGGSMEPVADTINYNPSDPLEKKNTICNIYDNTYPSTCSKGYWCLPTYPNGTGYCTSQVGLVTVINTNGNFRYDFKIYGFGLGKQIILKYYGSPNFEKTDTGYIENYAYLPTTTILSLNYGVLPLKLGDFISIFVIFVICFSIALIFIFRKKKPKIK